EAQITNKSGIASASCFWRVKGQANWTKLPLLTDNDLLFKTEIVRDVNLLNDTIEYYISATSNNGKTITKPFTAPKGFYWFYHGKNASPEAPIDIYEILGITDNNTKNSSLNVENLFPNPANEMTQLVVSNNKKSPLHIKMVNMMGQIVYSNTISIDNTSVIIQLQTASFSPGFYNIIISDNDGNRNVKKLIIQH
ncbi:MAG: T9SS type A sorting domain-containing protein, partial [Bacteroidales bacterium]|nr:T9SS type A sorting domain-containing protein [Bacteroidales bacterium]